MALETELAFRTEIVFTLKFNNSNNNNKLSLIPLCGVGCMDQHSPSSIKAHYIKVQQNLILYFSFYVLLVGSQILLLIMYTCSTVILLDLSCKWMFPSRKKELFCGWFQFCYECRFASTITIIKSLCHYVGLGSVIWIIPRHRIIWMQICFNIKVLVMIQVLTAFGQPWMKPNVYTFSLFPDYDFW